MVLKNKQINYRYNISKQKNLNYKGFTSYFCHIQKINPCTWKLKSLASRGRLYKKVLKLTTISANVNQSEPRILYLINID